MKKSLIALALVAGCGGAGPERGNDAAPAASNAAGQSAPDSESRGKPETAGTSGQLTGLWESGSGQQKNQLCIVDKATGNAQFGLIVWGGDMHSCSGAGSAVRSGERLTLTMAGDSACSIDATMDNGTIRLPASVPAGCSYYCGARAQLTNATFERTGSTVGDAMKAKDLAGDKLCEGAGG